LLAVSISRSLVLLICLTCLCSAQLSAQDDVMGVARRAAAQTIRPGDRIDLRFLRDRELNATLTVDERGQAVFPKLGTLQVSTIAIGALRDTLATRYSEFIRDAELEVAVLRRVVVNGEVRVPDVYYLDGTSGVRDAIAKAGGALESANRGKVVIVRGVIVRGSQRIRARRWESSQSPVNDVQSGDQIVVPRQPWLVINALPVISTSVIVIGLIRSLKN
jgi:protein involved in polysaccharide export with SLBB domain